MGGRERWKNSGIVFLTKHSHAVIPANVFLNFERGRAHFCGRRSVVRVRWTTQIGRMHSCFGCCSVQPIRRKGVSLSSPPPLVVQANFPKWEKFAAPVDGRPKKVKEFGFAQKNHCVSSFLLFWKRCVPWHPL